MVSRRTLLKYGLGASGLLAIGGVGLSLQPTVLTPPTRALKVLDPTTFSVLSAVARTVNPGSATAPSADDLQIAHQLDDLFASSHPGVGEEITLLLRLLENGVAGLLLDGRPKPFTACSAAVQARTLQAWRTSRLTVRRLGYKALRGLCAATYYADPRSHASAGYPGPPMALLRQALVPDAPPTVEVP